MSAERDSAVLRRRKRERLHKSRSPKRPGTPEPDRKVYSEESDAEETVIRRTRSRERPPKKDTTTEIEDDFEIIRSMHRAKEIEDDFKEEMRIENESKPKTKEDMVRSQKELPALIEAPKEVKKPKRPKTLPLVEETPEVAPRVKKSPEEGKEKKEDKEKQIAVKSKLILKPAEDGLRQRKQVAKEETKKLPEIVESKPWFFQKWFNGSGVPERQEENKELQQELLEESEEEKEKAYEDVNEEKFAKSQERQERCDKDERMEKPEEEEEEEDEEEEEEEEEVEQEKVIITEKEEEEKEWFFKKIRRTWKDHADSHPVEYAKLQALKYRCLAGLVLLTIYCGLGGITFRFIEGAFESFYKCGVRRVKRDFIDSLWKYSQYMPQEDWKSQARRKLMDFENELHMAHEAGMTSYSGLKSWSFSNAVLYCLTIVTTIGYGHLAPVTTTGRAITIIYAIFGIPMFLILLADFGKLFTRGIKFIWAYVRRLYYTGSCKKVRRTAPMQEMMKGVQMVYDLAAFRRPSQIPPNEQQQQQQPQQQTQLKPPEVSIITTDFPDTPVPSQFEIDDEFNLPISVAITILLIYIFVGATLYCLWEDWSFFESFYFVFISMSTIGFGDFVPKHPMYMMASIIYLIFGLALTSMCINVVQEKLSDTFRQASVKIGATIGLNVPEQAEEELQATE